LEHRGTQYAQRILALLNHFVQASERMLHSLVQDCDELGVCGVYAPRGLTAEVWNKGLAEYAKRKQGSKR
jgi:hypothetical protein